MSTIQNQNIQSLRQQFHQLAINKEDLLNLITEAEVAESVYNSNAIENSTLTLEETEKLLLQIDLDRFVTEREIWETKNLARVVEYITKKAKQQELNLETILLLHKILISNIRDDIAGKFRSKEWVRVGSHIAPAPEEVVTRLNNLLAWYYASDDRIVKKIAKFHLEFESIHPFVDGNGRIGRVLNNYILIREGFVPININFTDRKKYYDAFGQFHKDAGTKIMEDIIYKSLSLSYHKRLTYLQSQPIITLAEYAKSSSQSYSNLLNKANRQTIPAFQEKGIWKIGVQKIA